LSGVPSTASGTKAPEQAVPEQAKSKQRDDNPERQQHADPKPIIRHDGSRAAQLSNGWQNETYPDKYGQHTHDP